MAKEIVVGNQLTNEMQEAGRALLIAIDRSDLKINNALWVFYPDIYTWRLILCSKETDRLGPMISYAKIQNIIKKIPSSQSAPALRDISIPSSKSNLINTIKTTINTGPGISGIRFSKNTINNLFIEDAYIYRVY